MKSPTAKSLRALSEKLKQKSSFPNVVFIPAVLLFIACSQGTSFSLDMTEPAPSLWQRYRPEIVIIAVLLAAQFILIAALLIQKRRAAAAGKKLKNALTKAEQGDRLLSALMENIPEGITICDTDLNLTRVSSYGMDLLGGSQEGRPVREVISQWKVYRPDGITPLPEEELPLIRAVRHGEAVRDMELVEADISGKKISLLCNAAPIRDAKGEITGGIAAWRDITERKEEESVLNEKMLEYSAMFEHSIVAKAEAEPRTGRFVKVNRAFSDLTGYSPEELYEMTFSDISHPGDRERIKRFEPDESGNWDKWQLEKRYIKKDGSVIWVNVSGNLLHFEDGRPNRTISVILDITSIKQAENALKTSLAEKDVLLKEIHHRVKNNMQVISSLLSLQADQSKDMAIRDILQEVSHRVRTMAMVHEKLYQSADMAMIDFAEYAESLLNYLCRVYRIESSKIRIVKNLEPVHLPVNEAIPLGLVLNELITNVLKHAFPDGRDGEMTLNLYSKDRNGFVLSIRDSGKGLPEGFDWRLADSLGLRLVQMLATQIHADMDVKIEEGTEFRITSRSIVK